MADNFLSRMHGQGGVVSSPYARNREQALQMEARREAELVQQRLADEAQARAMSPRQAPQDGMTIAQYVANMQASDPKQPWVRQAPPESPFMHIPGVGNLLQMLWATQAQPDAQTDARLGRLAGDMALNNQRIRQRLDDFERERIRAAMLLRGQ